jgi:hypothetical protein
VAELSSAFSVKTDVTGRSRSLMLRVVLMVAALGLAPASGVAATWTAQRVVDPLALEGQLSAVSCPSLGVCVAVGSYVSSTDPQGTAPLGELWAGGRWMALAMASPADSQGTLSLNGVSCSAPNACTAVGSYVSNSQLPWWRLQRLLAERWNGSVWTVQPMPISASGMSLDGVACPSQTECFAVGSSSAAAGTGRPLLARWNGVSWSIVHLALPALAGVSLNSVSCSSPRACTAVGSVDTNTPSVPLVERWNGSRWSRQPSSHLRAGLSAVSCPSAHWCMAAGSVGTGEHLRVARWNGRAWSDQRLPDPAPLAGEGVAGLSCASAKACTVVGWFSQAENMVGGFAERWNGTHWSVQPVGHDAGQGSLNGVACPSTRACTAVGESHVNVNGGTALALAERWTGSRWSAQDIPNGSSPASGQLNAVSCSSLAACTAVGSYSGYYTSGWKELPLIERWDGSSWTLQTPPDSSLTGGQLYGVSCPSTAMCIAVGNDPNYPGHLLVEAWDGTSWTIQTVPAPAGGTGAALSGVSCSSTEDCVAVGNVGTANPPFNPPFIERWDGSTWSIQNAPVPANSDAYLSAVSCVSPTDCTAVGYFNKTGTSTPQTQPLVESWHGGNWTIVPAPSPGFGELAGVSCTSTSACTAVGGGYASTRLAEHWNGSAWTIDSTVTVNPGMLQLSLSGVSCTSQTACTGVGASSGNQSAAEAWNGTTWTLQSTPSSVQASPTQFGGIPVLKGISCPSPGICVAVGSAYYNGNWTPLAELYS